MQAAWASVGRVSASSAKHDARSTGGGVASAGGRPKLSAELFF